MIPFVLAEGLKLTCGDKDMKIVIPKNIIHNLHHEHLRLNDPACQATHNKTHYILETSLTGCGTTSRQVKDYIVYSNKVIRSEHIFLHESISTQTIFKRSFSRYER